ncbi:hypothetical protein [Psychrilyobacter sp.]
MIQKNQANSEGIEVQAEKRIEVEEGTQEVPIQAEENEMKK